MEKNRSLLLKMVLSIGLPTVIVFALMIGILLYTGNAQSVVWITGGIGLVIMMGVIILASKGISTKINDLTEVASRLAIGDTAIEQNRSIQNSRDRLGELSLAIASIAENMKIQSIVTEKMADGDLAIDIQPISEKDLIGKNLIIIRDSIKRVETDTAMLSDLTGRGIFNKKGNAIGITGNYKKIIENVNQTIDNADNKIFWYESMLDAIPNPILVADLDVKWAFINKILEGKLQAAGIIKDRESVYGTDCCEFNIAVCNSKECTDACAIYQLISKGITEMKFEFEGSYNQKNTNYVKNRKGENIGYIEMSSDLTSVMSGSVYTNKEVTRLKKNLLRLAEGDLEFDTNIAEANEYTIELHDQFTEIGENLNHVKSSISQLIEDATKITTAAIEGKLDTRVDETKFNGSWKTLIGGMNNFLEEIARPTREIADVMNKMSIGNLQVNVNGEYKGEFDELKQSVNNTAGNLNMVVSKISEVTKNIANEDLDIESVEIWQNDFADVSHALNKIIETLNSLIGNINDAAKQVTAGSNQVSDASQALAQGSTEQASSVQELSASIAEIADQTKQNAMNANKAKDLTTDVQEYATKGNAQMAEMQNSMTEINKSSSDISKIIKVIDDIAFQTNILALNAAVEAARAGQHGKGFAVVAEEVRTLAARSAEAAKETSGLIEGSIEKVKDGTKIADETAAALNEIVEGIVKVTDLVGNIAEDSNEQASGIAQVNMGIEQVAQVVQNNSATAEQSAAASEELSGQAEMLKEMIGQFQLRK
ncbi:methyl-accepting chemotaxis protein [Acetobacterium tundrae]|uniref:Methyl-accepting chemotaxis protein n=1 Tax=Acetobacterium tundrae TaxID=132932 RepID=A0ABR6WJ22_9FIRM|nr:methyl-accepting chemotaxis protein [Acetobacterium tundrae]MBC3796152.1 methyl-accepting chemotaxis protein [Acetobacterium tundrae]